MARHINNKPLVLASTRIPERLKRQIMREAKRAGINVSLQMAVMLQEWFEFRELQKEGKS